MCYTHPVKKHTNAKELIFNGTGVNYSWHFPILFDLSVEEFKAFERAVFISGGSTAFLIYWALQNKLLKWKKEDFLQWNKAVRKVYRNNLASGTSRMLQLARGSSEPVFKQEDTLSAWKYCAHPEFLEVRLRDLPANVQIPLINRTSGEVEIASPNSAFGEFPAYLVSMAATAIPKVFPEVALGSSVYGDITFAKNFLPWLKETERGMEKFVNYNLLKNAVVHNGEYVKICDHPNPKKMMKRDNLKFIFGVNIESYPNNVRRSKM